MAALPDEAPWQTMQQLSHVYTIKASTLYSSISAVEF